MPWGSQSQPARLDSFHPPLFRSGPARSLGRRKSLAGESKRGVEYSGVRIQRIACALTAAAAVFCGSLVPAAADDTLTALGGNALPGLYGILEIVAEPRILKQEHVNFVEQAGPEPVRRRANGGHR